MIAELTARFNFPEFLGIIACLIYFLALFFVTIITVRSVNDVPHLQIWKYSVCAVLEDVKFNNMRIIGKILISIVWIIPITICITIITLLYWFALLIITIMKSLFYKK